LAPVVHHTLTQLWHTAVPKTAQHAVQHGAARHRIQCERVMYKTVVRIFSKVLIYLALRRGVGALGDLLHLCFAVTARLIIVCLILARCCLSVSAHVTDLSPSSSVSVCVCVCICPESVLWQNGRMDPNAVWHGEWGRSKFICSPTTKILKATQNVELGVVWELRVTKGHRQCHHSTERTRLSIRL